MKLGRRDFLKGLGATATALMLPRGLAGKAEAERLVTPERGGLLVPPEQRVALIDEFELSTPMWQGGIFVSDELMADLVYSNGFRKLLERCDQRMTEIRQARVTRYVNGENPAARDLPGYGLMPDAPMATIAYALQASGDRPATITLWALPVMRAVWREEGEPNPRVNAGWEWVADQELPCQFTSSTRSTVTRTRPDQCRTGGRHS